MKRLAWLLSIVYVLTLTGCISGGGGGGGDSGGVSLPRSSDVTLSFDFGDMFALQRSAEDPVLVRVLDIVTMADTCYAAHLYDFITACHIEVTGAGMTPIVRDIAITDPPMTFTVTVSVPNGPARRFYIELRDRNGFVLYSGVLIIDVGNGGLPQQVSIEVAVDEDISADDYVAIGRKHLEKYELELAYLAFDTGVSIHTSHPVASFFRGLTRLLLLIQKDNPGVGVVAPHPDMAALLSLYANVGDIYQTPIAPDIYNEQYGEDFEQFMENDYTEPAGLTTDSTVDVVADVLLPEIEAVINDFAKMEAHLDFLTTLTADMHFGIDELIYIDQGDVYILETIAYGLQAYYQYLLAYELRTDVDYWRAEMEKKDGGGDPYPGLQSIIDNDPGFEGEELFDFTGAADTWLTRSRTSFSRSLSKLKAGLTAINARPLAVKNAEEHLFNVADASDGVADGVATINIAKVITTIDDIQAALSGAHAITAYDDYDDTSPDAETVIAELSAVFDTSVAMNRDRLPFFYYHSDSGEDVPVFDTNNNPASSAAFIESLLSVVKEVDGRPITDMEDVLDREMLPTPYRFVVPHVADDTFTVDGRLTDFEAAELRPVMFDEMDDGLMESLDIRKVYLARDNNALYVAIELGSTPYTGEFGEGDWLNYSFRLNARDSSCDWYTAPITVELAGSENGWEWRLHSYGDFIATLTPGLDYAMDDVVEFAVPFDDIQALINQYQQVPEGETWQWDGKDVFVDVSLWSRLSSQEAGDWMSECLAGLNIPLPE